MTRIFVAATTARKAGLLNVALGRLAVAALLVGGALFSADLALRAFRSASLFKMAAPTGGVIAIAGWLALAAAALLAPRRG